MTARGSNWQIPRTTNRESGSEWETVFPSGSFASKYVPHPREQKSSLKRKLLIILLKVYFLCGGSLTGPETASASVHDPKGRENASHTLYLSSNIQSNIEISQRCFCLLGTPYTTLPEKNGEGISSMVWIPEVPSLSCSWSRGLSLKLNVWWMS